MSDTPKKEPIIGIIQELLALEDNMDFEDVQINDPKDFALFGSVVAKLNNARLYKKIAKTRLDWMSDQTLSANLLDYATREKDADLAAFYFRSTMKSNLKKSYENYYSFVNKQIKLMDTDFVERIFLSRHSRVINEFLYDPMFSDGYNGVLPLRFLLASLSALPQEGGFKSFLKIASILGQIHPHKKNKFEECLSGAVTKTPKSTLQVINDRMTSEKWPSELIFVMEALEKNKTITVENHFPSWKTYKQKRDLLVSLSESIDEKPLSPKSPLKM